MPEPQAPVLRFGGALWALLLLPAGLGIGWLVGQAPTPKSPLSEVAARPAEVSQWTTLESAIAESRANGKPVLIDFSADWCGPCRSLKQEVFENGVRGRAVQTAVIPVSIVDRTREDGRNPSDIEVLQRQYQVDGFPTLVVFSPATGRTVKTAGFGDAELTLGWITEAARSVR